MDNNTKPRFQGSPDLTSEFEGAVMGAGEAHRLMSAQALRDNAKDALIEILLDHYSLYEDLRERAQAV